MKEEFIKRERLFYTSRAVGRIRRFARQLSREAVFRYGSCPVKKRLLRISPQSRHTIKVMTAPPIKPPMWAVILTLRLEIP